MQGSAGPQGPPGPSHLNSFQKSWNVTTTDQGNGFPCCNTWHTINESQFQMTTAGGSLLVALNIQLNGGSHGTCQTIIDGQWAGSYSQGAVPGPVNGADVYWKEGLQAVGCCGGGWRPWRVTRIYPGVPAGTHTFAVQCATDGGTMTSCDGSSVSGCSISVVELP